MLASLTTLGSNVCDTFGGGGPLSLFSRYQLNSSSGALESYSTVRPNRNYPSNRIKLSIRLEERKVQNEFLRSYL
jgi:hypothetical protein